MPKNKVLISLFVLILNCLNLFALSEKDSTKLMPVIASSLEEPCLDCPSPDPPPARLFHRDFMYGDNQRYSIDGQLPLKETSIKTIPAIITGGVVAGLFIGLHEYQKNTIWKDKATKFKIAEDMYQEIYLDKFGHFYGGYLDSYIGREALLASGFSDNAANAWGAVLGLGYQTYIEVLDGYGDNWGFSPSDFYFDAAGSAFFLAQHYVPYLQNVTPKFIYIPGAWTGDADRKGSKMFMDNYSSQIFFFSFNLGNMLPDSWAKHYPKWLQPSIGYRVKNLNQEFARLHKMPNGLEIYGDCKYLFSFDIDLVKVLPDGPPFWNWLRQGLNLVKIPTPTIEFGEGTKPKFYLFYPFAIKISI